METYNCPLDESVTVIEIEADDDFHAKFGWACTILGETQPVIVVDCLIREEEWFTEDHLLAIFAHELGHIQLQSEDEFKADEEWRSSGRQHTGKHLTSSWLEPRKHTQTCNSRTDIV